MWLANIVSIIPFKVRLIATLVVFGGLFFLAGPIILNYTGLYFVLIFLLFFDRIIARTEHQETYVEEPVPAIRLEDGVLHVGQFSIAAEQVQRIALGNTGRRGYLQFPFNPGFKARLSFPTDQIAPLSMHLKQLLPKVTLVE